MARTARTRADVRRRYDIVEDIELIEAVCTRFCEGDSPTQVREAVEQQLGRALTREQPYQILSFAAMNGLIRYLPPLDYHLAARLKEDHPLLEEVEVVQTTDVDRVAARAAKVLLRVVQQIAARDKDKKEVHKEVHIGLAGGGTILRTVKAFGELLSGPVEGLPEKLVFHAMVTGLQLHDPRTDPNTFFNYLPFGAQGWLSTEFVALHGPALPSGNLIEDLQRNHRPTRTAFEEGKQIEVIVTSGTSWRGKPRGHYHSQLKQLMEDYQEPDEPNTVEQLEREQGCVGDMLWQPVSETGPIENKTQVRAMTLWPLSELPKSIKRGAKVLLVLGPCKICRQGRGDFLRTVLGWKDHYITHLVADGRTASL